MNDYALTYWTEKVRQREQRVREFARMEDVYRMMGLRTDSAFQIQARDAAKKYDVALQRLENVRSE